jgi:methyl-accepting chemotaxis protein
MQRIQPVLPSFKNMTIKTKVIAAFAAMLAVTVGLGIFANLRLAAVNEQAADIRDNWLSGTRALGELSVDTERYRIAEANYVMAPTAELLAVAERNLRFTLGVRDKAWAAYEPLISSGTEHERADEFLRQWRRLPRGRQEGSIARGGRQAGRGAGVFHDRHEGHVLCSGTFGEGS